jgi:hypothetical protein
VRVAGGAITKVKTMVDTSGVGTAESVTSTLKVEVPAAVGVPER